MRIVSDGAAALDWSALVEWLAAEYAGRFDTAAVTDLEAPEAGDRPLGGDCAPFTPGSLAAARRAP